MKKTTVLIALHLASCSIAHAQDPLIGNLQTLAQALNNLHNVLTGVPAKVVPPALPPRSQSSAGSVSTPSTPSVQTPPPPLPRDIQPVVQPVTPTPPPPLPRDISPVAPVCVQSEEAPPTPPRPPVSTTGSGNVPPPPPPLPSTGTVQVTPPAVTTKKLPAKGNEPNFKGAKLLTLNKKNGSVLLNENDENIQVKVGIIGDGRDANKLVYWGPAVKSQTVGGDFFTPSGSFVYPEDALIGASTPYQTVVLYDPILANTMQALQKDADKYNKDLATKTVKRNNQPQISLKSLLTLYGNHLKELQGAINRQGATKESIETAFKPHQMADLVSAFRFVNEPNFLFINEGNLDNLKRDIATFEQTRTTLLEFLKTKIDEIDTALKSAGLFQKQSLGAKKTELEKISGAIASPDWQQIVTKVQSHIVQSVGTIDSNVRKLYDELTRTIAGAGAFGQLGESPAALAAAKREVQAFVTSIQQRIADNEFSPDFTNEIRGLLANIETLLQANDIRAAQAAQTKLEKKLDTLGDGSSSEWD